MITVAYFLFPCLFYVCLEDFMLWEYLSHILRRNISKGKSIIFLSASCYYLIYSEFRPQIGDEKVNPLPALCLGQNIFLGQPETKIFFRMVEVVLWIKFVLFKGRIDQLKFHHTILILGSNL